jgi:hypothetical protein
MPKQDPIAARRLLVAQVRDLATGVAWPSAPPAP